VAEKIGVYVYLLIDPRNQSVFSEVRNVAMSRDDANGEQLVPNEASHLLLEIAKCPVVQCCLEQPERSHPCAEIVLSQGAATIADFQVPEPWSGPIATAPILFISSNPSISRSDPPSDLDEEYPTRSSTTWPDARLVDSFDRRFGGGQEEWTRRGIFYRRKDGTFTSGNNWVRFWASAKERASEALGRPAVPGHDYAMTEVVRCKSKRERGVHAAACECPDRYLDRTLSVANAGLLICFGNFARDEMRRRYNLPTGHVLVGPVEIAGRNRYVVFLPHPNRPLAAHRPEKKKLIEALTADELTAVQSFLREADRAH
jgi:hypothetical protein